VNYEKNGEVIANVALHACSESHAKVKAEDFYYDHPEIGLSAETPDIAVRVERISRGGA
jgi:hypothetical protein